MSAHRTRTVAVGDHVRARTLATVVGGRAELPEPRPGVLTHLQFRRFAGCPVCNLHLRGFAARHDELAAAGVRELVLFHAGDDDLRPHVSDLPFAVVGDPDKVLYAEFGVESSRRSLGDPRAWPTIARALAVSLWSVARGRGRAPRLVPHGGRWGLPADLLIDHEGRVVAVHYGDHADDQWSLDGVLALAATTSQAEAPTP